MHSTGLPHFHDEEKVGRYHQNGGLFVSQGYDCKKKKNHYSVNFNTCSCLKVMRLYAHLYRRTSCIMSQNTIQDFLYIVFNLTLPLLNIQCATLACHDPKGIPKKALLVWHLSTGQNHVHFSSGWFSEDLLLLEVAPFFHTCHRLLYQSILNLWGGTNILYKW